MVGGKCPSETARSATRSNDLAKSDQMGDSRDASFGRSADNIRVDRRIFVLDSLGAAKV